MPESTCVVCRSTFQSKSVLAKYCTRKCANRSRYMVGGCYEDRASNPAPTLAPEVESMCGTWQGRGRHRTLGESPCGPCKDAWNAYCRVIQKKVRRGRACTDLVVWVAPVRVHTPDHSQGSRVWRDVRCRVCSSRFTTSTSEFTCSRECRGVHRRQGRKIAKDRRRAVKRGAYRADVSRKRVFESDGYRCHLCNQMTDPSKPAPHPRSPTLDHVIPLASGGTHEPSNCRTACFLCNSTKSNLGGGEQFALVF